MLVQISAGNAPIESCRFVFLFLHRLKQECLKNNISVELVESVAGGKLDTLKSALLRLSGDNAPAYAKGLAGSMLWICQSDFRPHHQRKNWYIEIEVFNDEEPFEFNFTEIKIETMRCSGNGGQNVNKLETGIRITHLPTGLAATAQEERSQMQNKKLALLRLHKKLDDLVKDRQKSFENQRWQKHQKIKRGEPVRIFKGNKFIESNRKER